MHSKYYMLKNSSSKISTQNSFCIHLKILTDPLKPTPDVLQRTITVLLLLFGTKVQTSDHFPHLLVLSVRDS